MDSILSIAVDFINPQEGITLNDQKDRITIKSAKIIPKKYPLNFFLTRIYGFVYNVECKDREFFLTL